MYIQLVSSKIRFESTEMLKSRYEYSMLKPDIRASKNQLKSVPILIWREKLLKLRNAYRTEGTRTLEDSNLEKDETKFGLSLFFQFSNLFKSSQWMTEWRLNDWLDEWMIERTNSDLRDWVYTLETETLFSLVSITRLRPRLKILESRDRDFDETFFWLFWYRDWDRDWNCHTFKTETKI